MQLEQAMFSQGLWRSTVRLVLRLNKDNPLWLFESWMELMFLNVPTKVCMAFLTVHPG